MAGQRVDGSGGYDMLIGPHADPGAREAFRKTIIGEPRLYIAQPTVALSRVPTFLDGNFKGCHVDLRAYVVQGETITVITSGLQNS